jgi:hypothetical protein
VAVDLDNAKHKGVRLYADLSDLVVENPIEVVAGAAGFVNDNGAVDLDLTSARAFHRTMTGNITELTFSNIPSSDAYSASWVLVLRIDATGGYTLSGTPTVTFVDGASWDDIDLTADAENILTFWRVGTTTYAALVTNGQLALDPYVMTFPDDGTILIAVARAEMIDLGSVTHLEADGTAGTGTLSYTKDGVAASGSTAFTAGEVLGVTLASSTTASAVSIPRFAA